MQLTLPTPHTFDQGRVVPREEWGEIVPTVTPIDKIVSRVCRIESTNEKWRLGKV